jgi:hypothetical protein
MVRAPKYFLIVLGLLAPACSNGAASRLSGAIERPADSATRGSQAGELELRLLEYNDARALLSLENHTDHSVYPAYTPTIRRRPAILEYRFERKVAGGVAVEELSTQRFDRLQPWSPVLPGTAVIFQASCPPAERSSVRVLVLYLESAETVRMANGIFKDPKTLEQKVLRRDRELKAIRSEWFELPAGGEVSLPNDSRLPAVNELPGPGEQDVIENELAVFEFLRDMYSSPRPETYGRLRKASGEGYCGYKFSCTISPDGEHYEVVAVPFRYGETGVLSFFGDEVGPIRAADKQGAPATATDPSAFDSLSRWR